MQSNHQMENLGRPDSRLFELDYMLDSGSADPMEAEPVSGGTRATRGCEHWPLDGLARIRRAARAVKALGDHARRSQLPRQRAQRPDACGFDPGDPDGMSGTVDALALGDAAQAELERVSEFLMAIADDYARAGAWLATELSSTWKMPDAGPSTACFGSALAEHLRIGAKAWLSADMNCTVARLLQRAVNELRPCGWAALLADEPIHEMTVRRKGLDSARETLERAATLARDYGQFVQAVDQRWQSLRRQIDKVVALPQG